jgi:hypothetical protein
VNNIVSSALIALSASFSFQSCLLSFVTAKYQVGRLISLPNLVVMLGCPSPLSLICFSAVS